jgi:hypothetical protein
MFEMSASGRKDRWMVTGIVHCPDLTAFGMVHGPVGRRHSFLGARVTAQMSQQMQEELYRTPDGTSPRRQYL